MLIAYLSVVAGGFAQTSVGFGLGLVSVAFLTTALGQGPAVRAVLILSLIANVIVVIVERSGLDIKASLALLVPSALTQVALFQIIRGADTGPLTVATGVVVIAAAALLTFGGHLRVLHGKLGVMIAGSASALMNLIAGLGGPAAVIYAANEGWSPHRWRPTLNLYFALNNALSLSLLTGGPPRDALLYASAALGAGAGAAAATRLPARTVRLAALMLSAIGGLLAIRAGLAA